MLPSLPGTSRSLRRLLTPFIAALPAAGGDRYRNHFPVTAHCWLLIVHCLWGGGSLRRTYTRLRAWPPAFKRLGLRQGLSFSQLARSSTSRPSAGFETLLAELIAHAQRRVIPDASWRLLRKVQVVDATFLQLSGALSPWCRHGDATPGVRVQTAYDLGRALPTRVRLTLTATNDHDALAAEELAAWRGWTLLIDLGYYGHRQFARLQAAGVSFVCRLQPQASVQVTAHRAVPAKPTPDGDLLLSDETITLGSPNNRRGAVLPGLRLVRSRNPRGVEQAFLTDRFDLSAAEIVRLYHYRWQIELLFRFLKHQLGLTTPLGHSQAAVWLTVLIVAIVAIVLLLLRAERPVATSRATWADLLASSLVQALRDG